MKYIIMCGGKYNNFETPKHLLKVNGEVIVERTIRLLKENGINDIAISTNNPAFEYLNIPLLKHDNSYKYENGKMQGWWLDAFYPTNEPTCYIFGDVYFSEEVIKTIVKTKVDDIELFGSAPPFAKNYCKSWVEPYALKVNDTNHLKNAIEKTKELARQGKTWRSNPIIWELWTVIKDVPLQTKAGEYLYNYIIINDYTTDVDNNDDVIKIENFMKIGGGNMIKVEAIKDFTLARFGEIKDTLVRNKVAVEGKIFKGDTFECTQELAEYLSGKNPIGQVVIKIIEVKPEKEKEPEIVETAEQPVTTKKKKSKKRVDF